jgi:hypothetical protein
MVKMMAKMMTGVVTEVMLSLIAMMMRCCFSHDLSLGSNRCWLGELSH